VLCDSPQQVRQIRIADHFAGFGRAAVNRPGLLEIRRIRKLFGRANPTLRRSAQ
jgi:hypothetical protein